MTFPVLGVWLAAALLTPALERRWGWPGLSAGLTVTVWCQVLAVVVILSAVWSASDVLAVTLSLIGGGWVAEYLGINTGVPFGRYRYTPRLRPQVGAVPALVPLAYVGVVVPAWGVADLLVGGSRGVSFVLVSGVVATAWDLLLDPILVSREVWEWRTKGGYFGIPWRNFLGWLLVTWALTVVLRPGPLDPVPLVSLYSIAWLTEVLAMMTVWRLPGPALAGGAVMGLIVACAWLRLLSP